jgi:hypothetical protein
MEATTSAGVFVAAVADLKAGQISSVYDGCFVGGGVGSASSALLGGRYVTQRGQKALQEALQAATGGCQENTGVGVGSSHSPAGPRPGSPSAGCDIRAGPVFQLSTEWLRLGTRRTAGTGSVTSRGSESHAMGHFEAAGLAQHEEQKHSAGAKL